jgi:hypothetical protein
MLDYSRVLKQLESSLPDDFNGEYPTNLLCLTMPQSYKDSELKVMVFGQETNDWYGSYSGEHNEDWLKEAYDEFFTSNDCFSYGGQFWNGVSRTVHQLENRTGKTVGLLWNNIVKIGKEVKGRPNQEILDWQKGAMSFILEELKVAKPDVVIFFTGPFYDDLLIQTFEDISFQELPDKNGRQLASVTSKHLPSKAVRTYHPNYLWRNDIDSYLNPIIDYVTQEN